MSVKRKLAVLLVVEILLIGLIVIRDHESYKVEPVEILTNHMENAGESFHIRDIHQTFETKTSILNINYGTLPSGTYKASVNYHANQESEQTLRFDCSNNDYIKANEIILDYRLNTASFLITVTHPVDDFTILLDHKGSGDFSFDIQLYRSRTGMIRNSAAVLMVFTILELAVYLYAKKPETFKTALCLFSAAMIAFLPYLLSGVYAGHDLDYHFLRIESILNGIQNGQFPVYLNPLFIGDYGYPASLYYCDLFLYIPVFFRIIGFSFNASYKLFVLIINLFTSVFAYFSFREIFKKKNIALVLSFVYVCAPFRIMDVYVRSAVGEFCAFSFLPLICAGFYGICMTESSHPIKHYKKYILFLSLGMSGILLSHMLTTEMTVFILLIVSIIFWKKILKIQRIKAILLSILICVLLSLFFIVPFLDFYIHNDIQIKNVIYDGIPSIQNHGMRLGELFMFSQDMFGGGGADYALKDRLYLSVGMVLTLSVIVALVCIFTHRGSKQLKLFTGMACLCLFLSSNLFPWDTLSYYTKFGVILAQIQFPWRFLIMAALFSTLTLGDLLSSIHELIPDKDPDLPKYVLLFVIFIVFTESTVLFSNYASEGNRIMYYNTYEIKAGDVEPFHVIRNDADPTGFAYEIITDHAAVETISRNGFHWDILCETKENEGRVMMPLLNYKGYHVFDEYGNSYEIMDGPEKEITFALPPDFQGKISVSYDPAWYWSAAIFVSLIISISLAADALLSQKKHGNLAD